MDLYSGIKDIIPEIMEKIDGLIENTQFIAGEEVSSFEKEFASYCRTKRAVACSNGTDALILILKAMGIGHGDIAITVPNTFIATAEAITAVGARPAFVDVEEPAYTMDPGKLEKYLENNTSKNIKAIIPVHLFGHMADMEKICTIAKKYSIKVIEDAAQAHGAEMNGHRAGYFGNAAAYSFYPGKNLGAFGDAGAVATDDDGLAVMIKMLSDHGRTKKYEHEIEGLNCRMDSIQAAVLRIKLQYLEEANAQRVEKAGIYNSLLGSRKDIVVPITKDGYKHVYHLYVIRTQDREITIAKLKEAGISYGIHYPVPLHQQKAFSYLNYNSGDFPVSEKLSKEILSLPLWPLMNKTTIEQICNTI